MKNLNYIRWLISKNVHTFLPKRHLKNPRHPYSRQVALCFSSSVKNESVEIDTSKIRNIGIIAHIDAGKTTTTERMLFYSGRTRHLGDVDDGNTVTDYMDQERDRGITITSAAVTLPWKQHIINLIDTPGHVDFTLEVERSLRVLDGAVAVLDAASGVQAQTYTVWNQANKFKIPRIVYINKMDKPRADVDLCLRSLTDKLGIHPILLHLPIKSGDRFSGLVDLVSMTKLTWEQNGMLQEHPLCAESDAKLWFDSLEQRSNLIGCLADHDQTLTDLVLNDVTVEDIPAARLREAIRRVTLDMSLYPVLLGSSVRNLGIEPLMDGVLQYLPDPTHARRDFLRFYHNTTLCALAFKTVHDRRLGRLTFLRVYAGVVRGGGINTASLYNLSRQEPEKYSKLYRVQADEFHEISQAGPGSIVAITGLLKTKTGDTLTSDRKALESSVSAAGLDISVLSDPNHQSDLDDVTPLLAGVSVPDPVYFCSVEPSSPSQESALDQALERLCVEDPSLQTHLDPDSGQRVLSGQGRLHLEVVHARLLGDEFRLDAHIGQVQIAYRERIRSSATHTCTLERTLNGYLNQVTCEVSVCPSDDPYDSAGVMSTKRRGWFNVPQDAEESLKRILCKRHVLNAVESGVRSALSRGPILGFPMVSTKVTLQVLTVSRETSMTMVTACVAQAVLEAIKQSDNTLLEPMMRVEITTEEDYNSSVLGDIARRRGQVVHSQGSAHRQCETVALVPLSELTDYSTVLRTLTSGRATFSMKLHGYEPMNEFEQNKLTRLGL